jgi:hypothetical protein
VWRLIAPGIFQWPLLPASFEQQVDTIKLFFIHDCINDLGRPMPIAEIGELVYNHGADQGQFDELIRKVLSPAEFAYAVAMGVLVLDLNPENLPLGHTPAPVLKLNPLYARKC